MDIDDLTAVYSLCQGARERFPEAWATFVAEFDEPVEARRDSFAAMRAYVNTHLDGETRAFSHQTVEERERLICIALLSFLAAEELYQEKIERFWKDVKPLDEDAQRAVAALGAGDNDLASFVAPPRPTGTAKWDDPDWIHVRFDRRGHRCMELLLNDRGTEWRFLGATVESDVFGDPVDPESLGYDEDEPPDSPVLCPLEWRYRVRFNAQRHPNDSDCIPVGMWSEEIPVTFGG